MKFLYTNLPRSLSLSSDEMRFEQYNPCDMMAGDGCSYCPPDCNQCEIQPRPSFYQQQQQQQQCEAPSQSNIMYSSNMSQCPPPHSQAQEPCAQYCDPCYQSCEPMCYAPPCEPQPKMQMCEQPCNSFAMPYQPKENYCEPCIDLCRNRVKTPCRRRYIQPTRRQSFKPSVCYKRPEIPMSDDTVYRRSFEGVDARTAACCRAPQVKPNGLLRTPCAKFEDDTVTQVSY
jgi:hypothetical protein